MLTRRLARQRGQLIPFWGLAVSALAVLMFFLGNYVNVVAWQIRAQNAADGAAAAGLSVQGNVFNQESTILYSVAVDENRIRYLNQAVLNTIYGIGGCQNQSGACAADYVSLVNAYNQAVNAYNGDMQLIQRANNFTEGGQQADEKKAVKDIGQGNCQMFDCAFAYNIPNVGTYTGQCTGSGKSCGTPPDEIDIATCHNVPIVAAALFGLGSNGSFQAIGRAAAVVSAVNSEVFSPGTAVNPTTNQVYQSIETQWASTYPSTAYTVDYTGLHVHLNWYGVSPIAPYSGALIPGSYSCT